MGYILFPYYQYIADVIYMFLFNFCSNFRLKFDFSLIYDENFISKKFKTHTEHSKSLQIITSLILSIDLSFREPWRRLLLWWAFLAVGLVYNNIYPDVERNPGLIIPTTLIKTENHRKKQLKTSKVKASENSARGMGWDGKERGSSESMATKEAKEIKEHDAAAKARIKEEVAAKALKKKGHWKELKTWRFEGISNVQCAFWIFLK